MKICDIIFIVKKQIQNVIKQDIEELRLEKKLKPEEVEVLLEEDEIARELALNLAGYFKEHFYLTESEIKKKIQDIFSRENLRVAEQISEVVQQFAYIEIPENNQKLDDTQNYDCKRFARNAINKILEIYLKDDEQIESEVFKILEEAKEQFKINVMSVAYKGVFRLLTRERYKDFLSSLDVIEEAGFSLENEEVKGMIEKCSSLLYRANTEKIRDTLEYLKAFSKDENGNFVLDVKNIIKCAPSVLLRSADQINETVCFLESNFSRKDIVEYVKNYPSILATSPNTVTKFENALEAGIRKICELNGVEANDDVKEEVQNTCRKLDRMITITGFSADQMRIIAQLPEIFQKHNIHPDKAIEKMLDINFLSKFNKEKFNTLIFDALLLKLEIESEKTGTNYIQQFFNNPNSIFNFEDKKEAKPKSEKSLSKPRNRRYSTPTEIDCGLSADEAENEFNTLPESMKKKVEELFDNLKENNENSQEGEGYFTKLLIISAMNELDKKEYEHPFLAIIDRIETAFDIKYGKGYAEKKYFTSSMKKMFEKHLQNMSEVPSLEEVKDAIAKIKYTIDYCTELAEKGYTDKKLINQKGKENGVVSYLSGALQIAEKLGEIRKSEIKIFYDEVKEFLCYKSKDGMESLQTCTYLMVDGLMLNYIFYPMVEVRTEFSDQEIQAILPENLVKEYSHQEFTTKEFMMAVEPLFEVVNNNSKKLFIKMKTWHKNIEEAQDSTNNILEKETLNNQIKKYNRMVDEYKDLQNKVICKIQLYLCPKNRFKETFDGQLCYVKNASKNGIKVEDGLYYFRRKGKIALYFPVNNIDEKEMDELGIKSYEEVVNKGELPDLTSYTTIIKLTPEVFASKILEEKVVPIAYSLFNPTKNVDGDNGQGSGTSLTKQKQ